MRSVPTVGLAFVLGLCLACACEAAADLSREMDRLQGLRDSVDVQADRIEYGESERKVMASGGVRVVLGTRYLYADEVSVDLDDQMLLASGHVILTEGLNQLEGDRIEYNYRTNMGVITNGRGTVEPGLSFSGVEIRKEGERQYALKEGRFTGCRACQPEPQRPDWEFRASEATIYQDEWIAARNASLWVKGIPSLFTPLLTLPLGPRRTGFLVPSFGYGNRDGFKIKQPYFWAISRSQDVTLNTTYRTKRGPDLDGQYRYILDEHSKGELTGRYLHDLLSDGAPKNRGEAHWLHDQTLSPTWTFKADAHYQSDQRLSRDFVDNSIAERTQRVLDSNVFLTQTTSQYMLLGLLAATEDLTDVGNKRLARLPDVRFQWLPAPLFTLPVVAEAETSAVYFEQSQAENAGRFDLHPAFHLPLAPFPWLTTATTAGFRETAFTATADSGGGANRLVADLGQRFGSTFLRRFENPGFGFTRLTHVVEPSVQYQYVSWVDQRSLLQFDTVDFVNPQNRLTFRLANRLLGRIQDASGEARTSEVASLTIAQSLNLQPKTREFPVAYLNALTPERVDQAVKDIVPLTNDFSQATERRLSDVVFEAEVRPMPAVVVHGTVAVNAEHVEVDAINSGVQVRLREDLTVDLGQSFVRDQQVDGLVSRIVWHATKNASLDLITLYDIGSSSFLENTALFRFSTCCWEGGLKYTHRTRPGQPDENSFQVTFEVKMPTGASVR